MQQLRNARALVPGEKTSGKIEFPDQAGNSSLTVEFEADLRNAAAAWIQLRHCQPGQAPDAPYRIAVALMPALPNR